jgi:hypothetical protein
MSASRGTTRIAGALPGNPGTAGNSGITRQGGQNSPGPVPVREVLGDELLDALLERSKDADGGLRLTGEGSMLGDLVKAVLERALEGELSAHLGYEKHSPAGKNSGNSRNGAIGKTVQTGIGPVRLSVPRDRAGTFEPVLVPKRAGRLSGGLDDMIISLYAHGMTVRDILHHLNQVYGTELSPEQVSAITDGVLEEVRAWQNRVLDPVWPRGVPGRDHAQGPRQPRRDVQARLHRPGRRRRRGKARAGHLDRQDAAGGRHRRGIGPLLGQRNGRPPQPRGTRYHHRLLRRADRFRGRHPFRVPGRGPANAPGAGRKPANGATSPHGSSRDNASWAGAKRSTNSIPPIPDASSNTGNNKPIRINLHT